MMTQKLFGAALAGIVLVLQGGCSVFIGQANFTRDIQSSVPMQAYQAEQAPALIAQTHNGWIGFTQTDRADISILAHVRATTQQRADAVEIITDVIDQVVSIYAKWPGQRKGSEGVSYEILAPAARSIQATTSNGMVEITGFSGNLLAETSNGHVTVKDHQGPITANTSNGAIFIEDANDSVQAHTSNGRVDVGLAASMHSPVAIMTSNGSVSLSLRTDFVGTIDATTSNGSIHLPTGLEHMDSMAILEDSKTHKRFRFGNAGNGPILTIQTSNGSIHIAAQK